MSEDDTSRYRVLVVDDDQSIRELICLALEEEGFELVQASNGEMAVELLERFDPHVILLDTRMPAMDGWEFARRYHERNQPHAPIVMLTAVDDPDAIASETGADAYLAKPFDLNDLAQVVRQQIEKS